MAVQAALVNDLNHVPMKMTAGAALVPGEVIPSGPAGILGVYAGIDDAANGDTIAAHIAGVFSLNAKSADTGSAGTDWYWDDTNNEATTTSSGNTFSGEGTGTKASGDTTVELLMNQPALP